MARDVNEHDPNSIARRIVEQATDETTGPPCPKCDVEMAVRTVREPAGQGFSVEGVVNIYRRRTYFECPKCGKIIG